MRLLWMSNAPWAGTGYGQQTKLLLPALQRLGHDPTCFAYFGLQGGKIKYDGYDVLPASLFNEWGNDVIQAHIHRSEAQVVVTLMDIFVLQQKIWAELPVPWAAWLPIDSDGVGVPIQPLLSEVDYPVAMSMHGAAQLDAIGCQVSAGIYHAVDTDIFAPQDKEEPRKLLGLDKDAFVIGLVMANKMGDRKCYGEHFSAIKRFADEHKDFKVQVMLHTEPTALMGGWDIKTMVDEVGLAGQVFNVNQYDTSVVAAPMEFMAQIYNACDVVMNCSAGEGFGVPIIEAQACGIPVIVGNYTAMPEIMANGYTVEASASFVAHHYATQFRPSVEDMHYKLNCVYRMSDSAKAQMGRDFVIANCSVPVVAEQWDVLLRHIEEQGPPLKTLAQLPEDYSG